MHKVNRPSVADLLLEAIDEYNAQVPDEAHIPRSLDVALLGPDGVVDSLGLVNLIVIIEQRIGETYHVNIVLADEDAMSQRKSPFRSIPPLIQHIEERLAAVETSYE